MFNDICPTHKGFSQHNRVQLLSNILDIHDRNNNKYPRSISYVLSVMITLLTIPSGSIITCILQRRGLRHRGWQQLAQGQAESEQQDQLAARRLHSGLSRGGAPRQVETWPPEPSLPQRTLSCQCCRCCGTGSPDCQPALSRERRSSPENLGEPAWG